MKHVILVMCLFGPLAFAGENSIERGEYLTTILGCGGCHTEGALLGMPGSGDLWLAGSKIGIAYTNDDAGTTPGIVFPGNLTSDKATGLGRWSKAEIARMIRTGLNHQGEQALTVMPWPNYSLLHDRDVNDIAAFLKSLPPVNRPIPENIEEGEPTTQRYVRFGVYIFDPIQPADSLAAPSCEDAC